MSLPSWSSCSFTLPSGRGKVPIPGGEDDRVSIPGGGWEIFSSTPRPDRLSGPLSLVPNGYRELFSWGLSGQDVKMTTQRMRGAIPPLSQYVFMAWCSVIAQGQLYLFTHTHTHTKHTRVCVYIHTHTRVYTRAV